MLRYGQACSTRRTSRRASRWPRTAHGRESPATNQMRRGARGSDRQACYAVLCRYAMAGGGLQRRAARARAARRGARQRCVHARRRGAARAARRAPRRPSSYGSLHLWQPSSCGSAFLIWQACTTPSSRRCASSESRARTLLLPRAQPARQETASPHLAAGARRSARGTSRSPRPSTPTCTLVRAAHSISIA